MAFSVQAGDSAGAVVPSHEYTIAEGTPVHLYLPRLNNQGDWALPTRKLLTTQPCGYVTCKVVKDFGNTRDGNTLAGKATIRFNLKSENAKIEGTVFHNYYNNARTIWVNNKDRTFDIQFIDRKYLCVPEGTYLNLCKPEDPKNKLLEVTDWMPSS